MASCKIVDGQRIKTFSARQKFLVSTRLTEGKFSDLVHEQIIYMGLKMNSRQSAPQNVPTGSALFIENTLHSKQFASLFSSANIIIY